MEAKFISESHRRNDSLSLNCLNSSAWSATCSVIARSRALSRSIPAFCLSELAMVFWYALSPAIDDRVAEGVGFLRDTGKYTEEHLDELAGRIVDLARRRGGR